MRRFFVLSAGSLGDARVIEKLFEVDLHGWKKLKDISTDVVLDARHSVPYGDLQVWMRHVNVGGFWGHGANYKQDLGSATICLMTMGRRTVTNDASPLN